MEQIERTDGTRRFGALELWGGVDRNGNGRRALMLWDVNTGEKVDTVDARGGGGYAAAYREVSSRWPGSTVVRFGRVDTTPSFLRDAIKEADETRRAEGGRQ